MKEELLRELLRRYQGGDREAGQELAVQLSPLVSALAVRVAYTPAEVDDFYQVGMLGMLKAAQRFRLSAAVKFTTFAVAWIKGEMRAYNRQYRSAVKVSRSLWEQSRMLNTIREQLMQALHREPTVSELARALGTTPEEVALAMKAALPISTLDEDLPTTREGISEEEELLERLSLHDGMTKLAPMERQIIIMRFFKELTQAEVAYTLALSQRQVSRLEKRILGQLRRYLQLSPV